MATDTTDTAGKKKFAFRDVRRAAELLASGRPPKSVTMKFINPVSKKLSKLKNKISAARARVSRDVSGAMPAFMRTAAASAATNALLGTAAAMFVAKLAGKVKLPGVGKLGGAVSKVQSAAGLVALGASIVEESNPDKIRRPLKEGLSASASAMAEPLAKTAAAGIATSLMSGSPLASGLPTVPRQFKTTASLFKSPRFFNPKNESFALDQAEAIVAASAVKQVTISTSAGRLYPQRGLLEDELMHRLTLLAENVYAPTNQYSVLAGWGALTILEGFRAENSTTSAHEIGEAIDITLGNGDLTNAERCFQLAVWMRDHILYDQLILCFDASGGGQVWIHASFRLTARRRQVLTKAFNDTHTDGLHHYQYASATTEQTTLVTEGENFSAMLANRQARLQPVGLDTALPQTSGGLSNIDVSAPGNSTPDGSPAGGSTGNESTTPSPNTGGGGEQNWPDGTGSGSQPLI